MASSSNVGRSKAIPVRTSAGAGIGVLSIPDPRTWPAAIRQWYRNAAGDCGPLEVFIFNFGETAAMFLHDAITGAGLLGAAEFEWHVEAGYPAFIFDVAKIEEFTRRLSQAGYIVRELIPVEAQKPIKRRGLTKTARVIDIESVRNQAKRAEKE